MSGDTFTDDRPVNIHATALLAGRAGVLIEGSSGAGKSSLALAALEAFALRGRFAALVGDELASELARAAVAERIALTNYAATTETYAEFSDIDAQLRSGGMRRLQDAVIVGGPTRPGVWRPLGLSLLLGAALGFALAQLEVIVRSGRKSVQGGVN